MGEMADEAMEIELNVVDDEITAWSFENQFDEYLKAKRYALQCAAVSIIGVFSGRLLYYHKENHYENRPRYRAIKG